MGARVICVKVLIVSKNMSVNLLNERRLIRRFKVQPHPDFPGQIMTSIFCRGGIEIKALVLRVFDGELTQKECYPRRGEMV